jgi:hypothetical protein
MAMKKGRFVGLRNRGIPAAAIVLAGATLCWNVQGRLQPADLDGIKNAAIPANVTRCDASLPISIELTPLDEPKIGRPTRFEAKVRSVLDPDLIRRSWVEWEVPTRVRKLAEAGERMDILDRRGHGTTMLDVIIPDESRYSIRARLVVQFRNGQTIGQTAVRWVDLGEEDAPEGMIGRMSNPDGTGIRVYRGATVRK